MPAPYRILCIDDDSFAHALYRSALGERFKLISILDPLDAEPKVNELKPDLIIVDIMMPGIEGLALIERLKQTEAGSLAQYIVISSFVGDEERDRCRQLGVDEIVSKERLMDELQPVVNNVLGQRLSGF